jgi:hypothetical protein
MADIARGLSRERWAHVDELMRTDSIDATAAERRAVFARLTERRAQRRPQDVAIPRVDGLSPPKGAQRFDHALADGAPLYCRL